MNTKTTRIIILSFLLLLNFGCDQISKNIARNEIGYNEEITVIKDRVLLTKVENSGAFLSLGNEMPDYLRFIILSGLPILALCYGLFYLFSKTNLPKSTQIALCFVIGGGAGNLYDRILHGSVTDFMHIDFYLFRTGIFNFADVSIMIGVGILIAQSLKAQMIKKTTDEN